MRGANTPATCVFGVSTGQLKPNITCSFLYVQSLEVIMFEQPLVDVGKTRTDKTPALGGSGPTQQLAPSSLRASDGSSLQAPTPLRGGVGVPERG